MATPQDPLPDTAIAASNNGSNLFVYFQAVDGSICEHVFRASGNSSPPTWRPNPNPAVKPEIAKFFSPIAAAVYETESFTVQRHVFYIDKQNVLREVYLSDTTWNTGKLDILKIEVAPFSQLSILSSSLSSKLFYQSTNSNIYSVTLSNGDWTKDNTALSTFSTPMLGTGLAAANEEWFTQANTSAIEAGGAQPHVQTGSPSPSSHTSLAAVGSESADYKAIFYTSNDSKLYDLRVGKDGQQVTYIAQVSPRSSIAAVRQRPSDNDPDVINVFVQRGQGRKISQFKYIYPRGWQLEVDAI